MVVCQGLSTTDAGIGKVASLAGAAAVEKARLGVPSNEVVSLHYVEEGR
jgi:hypothetical protein